jgi:large subunit ribosomal protein L6
MSRIGKKPIPIPEGVKVDIKDGEVTVTGPKGSLKQSITEGVVVKMEDNDLVVASENDTRRTRAFQGLVRSLLSNMVAGVSQGIEKTLEINGLGYRDDVEGKTLVLNIGYSQPVRFQLPEGIEAKVDKNTVVTIQGIDKQLVGQVAADIRNFRKPEPYKGKGIKYIDEKIRRKAGKTGA